MGHAKSSEFVNCKEIKEFASYDMKIPVHEKPCLNRISENVKKQICSLVQKVDLIEQNQRDFWIQHIKIILNQLKTFKQ